MKNNRTILLIDDDLELVDAMRHVLERRGYHVVHAPDGNKGKQAIYNIHPHLVILDMMMPKMGGFPVLEHFKDKDDVPPIIMVTANEGSRHKAYAEFLGVVTYLRKPFAMEKLLEEVEKALDQSAKNASDSSTADADDDMPL